MRDVGRAVMRLMLLLILTAAPLAALDSLILREVWLLHTLAGVVTATIALFLLRSMTDWIVWPTAIALLGGIAGILAVEQYRGVAIPFWPLQEAVFRRGGLLINGVEALRTGVAPVGGGVGVVGVGVLVASAVLVLFVAGEALSVGAESPALAGIPMLMMWLPHIFMRTSPSIALILVGVAAFLILLAITASSGPPLRQSLPFAVAVTVAAVIGSLVVSPWALSAPSVLGVSGSGSATNLDLGLDVRADLLRGSNRPLIEYEGMSPSQLGPVHSYTLSRFDGQRWHGEQEDIRWLETTEFYPFLAPTMIDTQAPAVSVSFRIFSLQQERLFLPTAPRSSPVTRPYSPSSDELFAFPGDDVEYVLGGYPIIGDPHVWHELSTHHRTLEGSAYLEVPQTSRSADINTLAREVTADASSPYEKAVAIQNFLRNDPRFTYTTALSASQSDDAVWDFLESGEGYCVQFSTAMVIMARAVGIPARMAVGFLPGSSRMAPSGLPGGVIMSHDAHTWPQLFLGEAGWARFEPTPAVRTGPVPESARGLLPETSAWEVEEVPTGLPSTDPAPHPSSPGANTAPAPPEILDRPGDSWVVSAAAALAILGLLTILAGTARRHGEGTQGVEDYWRLALEALESRGLVAAPGDTPLSVLQIAHELLGDTPALAAFSQLTAAINTQRYDRQPATATGEQMREWLEQICESAPK